MSDASAGTVEHERPHSSSAIGLMAGAVASATAISAPAPVHPEGSLHRRLWRAGQPRRRARRAFADLLVADLGGVDQVRDLRPAGRQRRRGGDGVVRAGASCRHRASSPAGHGGGRRPDRRRAVLRRQHDHPGDLGALRHRGPGDRLRRPGALGGADVAGGAGRPVPHPEAWHRAHRHPVRPGDGGLVPRPRGPGHLWRIAGAGSAQGDEPDLGDQFLRLPPRHRRRHPRRHGAGADRRRGVVRRHGPLRPQAHRPRLVRPGAAGAGAELLRPGRDHPGQPGGCT